MRVSRIVLPALAAVLAITSSSLAGIPSPRRYASAARRQMMSSGNAGRAMSGRTNQGQSMVHRGQQQVVQELRMTRALLIRADHDYQGQRSRAVEQINVALGALGHGVNGNGNGNGQIRGNGAGVQGLGNGAGNRNGVAGNRNGMAGNRKREPQAASDAQVRRAYQNLTQIHSQLGSMPGQRDARARVAVMKAASHLQMALTIR